MVTVRAHGDIRHLTGRQPLGTAKVGDAHRAIVVHKHVAALQVAVNDAAPPVQVGQTFHDMAGNVAFRAKTVLMAILHERVQVTSQARVHYVVQVAIVMVCSVGAGHVQSTSLITTADITTIREYRQHFHAQSKVLSNCNA